MVPKQDLKDDFLMAKQRLLKAYDTTRPDKVNVSPSATARTPIEILAHCAMTHRSFFEMIQGKEFPSLSIEELDAMLREEEKKFKSADEAKSLLETEGDGYLKWLDAQSEEDLQKIVVTPFFSMPTWIMCQVIAGHLYNHAAQIAYLQTVYGDRNWYMGDES